MQNNTLPTWDLSDLYAGTDDPALSTDIEAGPTEAAHFADTYKDRAFDGSTLLAAIHDYEAILDRLHRTHAYALLRFTEDKNNAEVGALLQQVREKAAVVDERILFFTLDLARMTDETWTALCSAEPRLDHYAPWMRRIRAQQPYLLSEECEGLIAAKSPASQQNWVRLYDETLARQRFTIDGERLEIGSVLDRLANPDATTRHKAAQALTTGLEDALPILQLAYNTRVYDHMVDGKRRGYPHPMTPRNLDNDVEDAVVDTLLETVRDAYPKLSHRYYRLKAKWMGVDAIPYWDRNAPLPDEDEPRYTWDEARETVLQAYNQFSPRMAELAEQFFTKNWIHAQPQSGKDNGAFSHPVTPSAHPYILVNFYGKQRDVMTLAHELGHGVHQLLAADQGLLISDTPLTLSETASVFAEMLTFQHLLQNTADTGARRRLLASKTEDMLNTVVRQVAFCHFEKDVHAARENGELQRADFARIWQKRQAESLGDGIKLDADYDNWWAYVSHFLHVPFYVYAYAFGDCLVNSLYRAYQKQPEGFEPKYLDWLAAGGARHHSAMKDVFGLDTRDPAFWQDGLDLISTFIDELESMPA